MSQRRTLALIPALSLRTREQQWSCATATGMREALARDLDFAAEDAFSFDGERCDRMVASVLESIASNPGSI